MDKRHLSKIKRRDVIARWLISIGGVSVIFCVLTMLVLITCTALPLFSGARAPLLTRFSLPTSVGTRVLAVGSDDYRETGFVLDERGVFTFLDLRTGKCFDVASVFAASDPNAAAAPSQPPSLDIRSAPRLLSAAPQSDLRFSLLWDDGTAALARVVFKSEFTGEKRTIAHRLTTPARFAAQPGLTLCAVALRETEDGGFVLVGLLPDQRLVLRRMNEDGEEQPTAFLPDVAAIPATITAFTVDRDGKELYVATDKGNILRWDIAASPPQLVERVNAFPDHRAITALGLVFGDVSLAVGDAHGGISTWAPVSLYGEGSKRRLAPIHQLASEGPAVSRFLFTLHDKSVVSVTTDGAVNLDHLTSERHLLTLRPAPALTQMALSLQGDTLVGVDAERQLCLWGLQNPHPEVSWAVLFGKVWYEGYDKPAYVWQSSSANDDNEAKFSFVPLVFGSFKATFYGMLLAIPIAIFGALYVSQFTTCEVRSIVKPTVEIMAAIPTVVIGFLAALWLAPRLERAIVGVFLYAFTLPLVFLVFMALWIGLRRADVVRRVERGYEFALAVPILLVAGLLAWAACPLVEQNLFHGDFPLWLFQEAGFRFDPRNSIVIAFALGFTVIPIIFTMSEDALSNVPKSLKAASLALGASRWQTVWHVVLPSASPGVFAALIIGFGRAVGETMIVLMATGNTPVLDWGPFTGMRTLSANIAVEIPEAPAGGSLFRILFLSAVLLFLLTSVLNTAAELIRHRLRKRYGY
ncbi:MAG: hypothetical protein A3K18_21585 [Lentisphaerae bacterium RIFOXYA12_64_32]|nr:MAG: hypothetical protein A3K18_21585 [Lentisphaerae bacterium RIFOXYA12_64_32]